MNFIAWLVMGITAGLLAEFAFRDKWSGGLAGNLIVGSIGAIIAGWIVNQTALGGGSGPTVWVIILSLAGAGATLTLGRMFTSPTTLN